MPFPFLFLYVVCRIRPSLSAEGWTMDGDRANCPCRKFTCKRHADCEKCRRFHEKKLKSPPYCERTPKKPEKRGDQPMP